MSAAPDRPRVVFDCNALLQALTSETGAAARAVNLIGQNRIELFLSRPVLRELNAVLHYPEVRTHFPSLTEERIVRFLEQLRYRSRFVRDVRHVFDYPRDSQDETYIDLAAAAKAQYLVSRDKDLLSLMTGHSLLCKQFRQKLNPLRIVTPEVFLHEIEVDRIRSSE